ncbi:MAG: RNA polymerase sigma factor [Planctomycetota bacterium]
MSWKGSKGENNHARNLTRPRVGESLLQAPMNPLSYSLKSDASAPRGQSPWLEAAMAGEAAAFDRLLRPMLGKLLALCRRLSQSEARAEELLQETLIRAHRGLSGFRRDASFRTWIVSILYRLASAPERLHGQVQMSELIPDRLAEDPLAVVSARDLLHRVEEAMERLPLRQRTALHLRAMEGWGYEEISRVLGSTENAARNSVLEARRKLRKRLGDLL